MKFKIGRSEFDLSSVNGRLELTIISIGLIVGLIAPQIYMWVKS